MSSSAIVVLSACACAAFLSVCTATECDVVLASSGVECVGGDRVRAGDTMQCVVTSDTAQAFIMSVRVKTHTGHTICGLAGECCRRVA